MKTISGCCVELEPHSFMMFVDLKTSERTRTDSGNIQIFADEHLARNYMTHVHPEVTVYKIRQISLHLGDAITVQPLDFQV